MEKIAAVVIGAGVVGLACARELAQRGVETLLVEQRERFGSETSARNSEVIHAGIYYQQGSLKAGLCRRGSELLYAYCAARGIAHRRCGKLIVASDEAQREALLALYRHGQANGVSDLRLLNAAQARQIEPALGCVAAIESPGSGIFDSHAYMLALLADAEAGGATLAVRSQVTSAHLTGDGIVLDVLADGKTSRLKTTHLINAGGLHAVATARRMAGYPQQLCPTARYAKGNYFTLRGKAPFSRLIYPLPETGGTGLHFTLDLAGQARFGPDVEWLDDGWIEHPEYQVDDARRSAFAARIRPYWPALRSADLTPAYCGVRPKVAVDGVVQPDFIIQGAAEHGVRGLVQLFGIESPGLTASLAIAELAVNKLLAA